MFSSLLTISSHIYFIILVTSLAFAWIFYIFKKNRIAFILILIFTVFFGSSLYSIHQRNFEKSSLYRLEFVDYADFYGRLYKSPSRGRDRDYLFLKVDKVIYQNKEIKTKGNLRVTVRHPSEFPTPLALHVHDWIKVSALLLSNKGYRNFKSFSLASYLKIQNIHRRAFSKSPLLVEKIDEGSKYSLLHLISKLRRELQKKIEEYFPSSAHGSISPQGSVLEALLLGERGRLDPSLTSALQKSGLYHLFAISGAHIAIISFLLFSLFKLLRFSARFSYILLIGFLLFYAFLVEGRPSVMRATIMSLIFLLGKLIWKDVNLLNTISLSAFFMLLLNPFNLFNVGFQLTFAATLSIILFYPRFIKFIPNLPLRISEIFTLSLTAQLGILPFIARSFNRITFSSLLLNFAALPLIGLIMASGYIFLPLSFVSSSITKPFAQAINFLISIFLNSTKLLEYVPFISYRIPTPQLITVIGYFSFLLLLLIPPKIKKQRLIFLLCFLLFFVILITYPFPTTSSNLKLTFIDVGQGDSILIEFPGSKKMLIDGGGIPGSSFDIGERIVSPFLWSKGIKRIHYIVLTHAHPDHLNGLLAVTQNFKIGELWEAFSPLESESYSGFKQSLSPEITQKRQFRGGILEERGVKVGVLHPREAYPFVESVHNDQSMVLRITYGQTSFLLASDIGRDAEREIIEAGKEIKSQFLKSPHHGSNSSSSQEFLDKVRPQIVVISVGEGNRFGLPNQGVIAQYQKIGAKVFRTDFHGAVEVSSDGQKLYVRKAVRNEKKDASTIPYLIDTEVHIRYHKITKNAQ
ncbi:MAG: DNA internalization-related competence protein ComEC/Rec2 [Candidatus Aminicenantaceae bacterium]